MFGTVRRIVRFWRVVQVLQVTGGMDSDTENDRPLAGDIERAVQVVAEVMQLVRFVRQAPA